MKVVDVANQIFLDLGEPSNLSVPPITTWLRNNIGRLNTLIDTEYVINPTTQEIEPELGYMEADIYKELYAIKYYERMVTANLGAASLQSLSAIQDGESSVKWQPKTEIAKYWSDLRKSSMENVKGLVAGYVINAAQPKQVIGDDNIDVPQSYSDFYYRSRVNRLDY